MSPPRLDFDWTLALAQMRVLPGEPEKNLERAEHWIGRARDGGAALVLLPEALDCGWTHPSARVKAGSLPGGAAFERLRAAAVGASLFVAAGLVERQEEKLYNAAVLIGPDGRLLLHHRKIHELDFARKLYACGDRLGVVDTALGRLGLMICADAFVTGQVISRTLGAMGAEWILSPCAWAVPPGYEVRRTPYGGLWVDHYGPVSREFGVGIAGCSNVGPVIAGEWAGWTCIGNSLVMGPGGEPLAWGDHGGDAEHLICVSVRGGGRTILGS